MSKDEAELGFETEYEHIYLKLDSNDVARLEYIIDGEKGFYNMVRDSEVIIKRRIWDNIK